MFLVLFNLCCAAAYISVSLKDAHKMSTMSDTITSQPKNRARNKHPEASSENQRIPMDNKISNVYEQQINNVNPPENINSSNDQTDREHCCFVNLCINFFEYVKHGFSLRGHCGDANSDDYPDENFGVEGAYCEGIFEDAELDVSCSNGGFTGAEYGRSCEDEYYIGSFREVETFRNCKSRGLDSGRDCGGWGYGDYGDDDCDYGDDYGNEDGDYGDDYGNEGGDYGDDYGNGVGDYGDDYGNGGGNYSADYGEGVGDYSCDYGGGDFGEGYCD